MTLFDRQTLIEAVLYILNVTKGIDFYHVFKILYFAEQKHLVKWGIRITAEDFHAYDYGPVPLNLYGAVKANRSETFGTDWAKQQLPSMFKDTISFAGEDAPNVLLAKRNADLDYLSESDIQCLDESIKENAHLTFNQLKEKSHDCAWHEAYDNKTAKGDFMSPLSIARAAGANDDMIEYISEQMEDWGLA